MELNKTYISKARVKRTPLQLSECGRFVKTETVFNSGSVVLRDYGKVIFEERIKTGLWKKFID